MIPIFKLQPPWFLPPPLHRHGKAFDRAAGWGASWQKGRGEESLRWWWRWRWMDGCLSTGMEQLAEEQANRREEVGALILDLSHWDNGDGCDDAHQRRMSHCDAIRRHSGGSFHVFDPKQVLVDLCRCGVAKVTGWLGIGETSGGLFKTKNKIQEDETINNWCPNRYYYLASTVEN